MRDLDPAAFVFISETPNPKLLVLEKRHMRRLVNKYSIGRVPVR
jgi:hypothetical protein